MPCFVLPVDRYCRVLFATFQMKLNDTVLACHRETAIFSGKRSCQSRDLKRRRTAVNQRKFRWASRVQKTKKEL